MFLTSYCIEVWTINNTNKQRIKIAEMKFTKTIKTRYYTESKSNTITLYAAK